MKKILHILPEYYLLALVILYWALASYHFNPFAIGLLTILVFQIISKNKYTGIVIGVLFFLLNFYMHFALLDEVREFSSFNADARQMFYTGFLIFFSGLIMSILMVNKYINPPTVRPLEIKAES